MRKLTKSNQAVEHGRTGVWCAYTGAFSQKTEFAGVNRPLYSISFIFNLKLYCVP
jgi:hypothetical protein